MNVLDVIDVIEHEQSEFKILTSDGGLQEFFMSLYGADSVVALPLLFDSIKNIPCFLKDLLRLPFEEFKILRVCEKIKPRKLIFFYIGYNGFESWLIKKLSKAARVYHRPIVDMSLMEPNPSPKNQIKTKIFSFLYGIEFSSVYYMGYPMTAIDNKFLSLVNAEKYSREFDQKNIAEFASIKLKVPDKMKVLLLAGPEYHIDPIEYKTVIQRIYTLLLDHYNADEIGIKHHPNFAQVEMKVEVGTMVFEKNIPGNLLMFSFDLVIGGASSILYQAGNSGATVISNIYMFKSLPKAEISHAKKYLLSNSKRKDFLFPKDLGELTKFLSEIA